MSARIMKASFSSGIVLASFAATMIASRSAHATEQDMFNAATTRGESPQHFALEFRVSPYTPNVDGESGLNGRTPFNDMFGSSPRFLVGAEFDWQALRIAHIGTLGPGVALSYTQYNAKSFTLQGTRSAEGTSLDILPMYLVAVLRADVLWRQFQVPIVPYVKGGLGYALWQGTNDGGGSTYTVDNGNGTQTSTTGKGHTWGEQFAVGISFAMNVIDMGAARNLDTTTGINQTYLFAEFSASVLNGIAQDHPLQLGDNTFAFGLSFEF